jgi:uncharacterized repeat protein (TIGR01451 family)
MSLATFKNLPMKALQLTLFTLCLITALPLNAVYMNRFTTTNNGGIAFTGNSLGLSKQNNFNQPGTADSDGAFITTDTTQIVGNYPLSESPQAGTTVTWQDNSASAYLDLPVGSTVLYAELVWAGSYGFGGQIPYPGNPFIPDVTPVSLTTPLNTTHSIAPDPTTSQIAVTPGFVNMGNYVRSQDVTSIIESSGGGRYIVGGVPGTIDSADNTHNAAGWTLAVVYSNPTMVTNNMTIFVGCEQASSSTPPAEVSGFCTPSSGVKSSMLFASAIEGDYAKSGEQLRFGPTVALTAGDSVSGTNNPVNNFFCSQINTLLPLTFNSQLGKYMSVCSALLDTRGSYGAKNFPTSGVFPENFGRQGFDITAVNVSSSISYNQNTAYAQGTTAADDCTLIALGIQIQIDAPILKTSKKVNGLDSVFAAVGDTVTFSGTVENVGTSDALSSVLIDILQSGLSYVPGTFVINSSPQPDPDLANGYLLGDIIVNDMVTFSFDASIDSLPTNSDNYLNHLIIDYNFVPYQGQVTPLQATSSNTAINFLPVAKPDSGATFDVSLHYTH